MQTFQKMLMTFFYYEKLTKSYTQRKRFRSWDIAAGTNASTCFRTSASSSVKRNIQMKKYNFEKSHSAEKSEKVDPLGFSNIYCVPKYHKLKEGPFGTIKKFSIKSLMVPKKSKLKTPR